MRKRSICEKAARAVKIKIKKAKNKEKVSNLFFLLNLTEDFKVSRLENTP
jgi:hypothetical protein